MTMNLMTKMWIKLYMAWIFTSIGDTIAKVEMNSGYINKIHCFLMNVMSLCLLINSLIDC